MAAAVAAAAAAHLAGALLLARRGGRAASRTGEILLPLARGPLLCPSRGATAKLAI